MKRIFLLSLVLMACGSKNNKEESQQLQSATEEVLDSISEVAEEKQEDNSTKLGLLAGKWRSLTDSSNYVVFEGDSRKEIASGMDEWTEENIILADDCQNEMNKGVPVPSADKYISSIESDICWYIISLTEDSLKLSYVGRGNTLAYVKVK